MLQPWRAARDPTNEKLMASNGGTDTIWSPLRLGIVDDQKHLRFHAQQRRLAAFRHTATETFSGSRVARRVHPVHFNGISRLDTLVRAFGRRQLRRTKRYGLVAGVSTIISIADKSRKARAFVLGVRMGVYKGSPTN